MEFRRSKRACAVCGGSPESRSVKCSVCDCSVHRKMMVIHHDGDPSWWWSFMMVIHDDGDPSWWWSIMMVILHHGDPSWWSFIMMVIHNDGDPSWCWTIMMVIHHDGDPSWWYASHRRTLCVVHQRHSVVQVLEMLFEERKCRKNWHHPALWPVNVLPLI